MLFRSVKSKETHRVKEKEKKLKIIALGGLAVSDVEPKFSSRSYEDLLVKTQSFSTLRAAGCPSIQAFKYSHLSQDPESDSMEFDAYQAEREESLNEMSVMGGNVSATTTSYSEDEEAADEEEDDSEDSGGSYATCPVCKRRFKKRNGNQIYDREECRRIARKQKSGGGFR